MGNRLNISLIVNLSSEMPRDLKDELYRASKVNSECKFGFMNNNYNYCDGKQDLTFYKDEDRILYSGRYDDTYWLEIHTCFKNYNNEFEEFWDCIKPYIIPHNGEDRPVGHFYDDSKMGLVMLDGLKYINTSDLK